MGARRSFLMAALLLSACTEGGSAFTPRVEPEAPAPVSPTDVLGGVPGAATATPPPAAGVEPEPPPAPPPVTARAAVVGLEEGARGLSSVSHVDVDVTMEGLRGKRSVSVEFIPPSGHPYERRATAVELRPDVPRTLRFALPVAGTTVATSGMSGTWQAHFFLDGEPMTSVAFTLEP
ncbi:hypothetical protein [Pyxidicoccus xibeiensis]|uniref:hypothetical protein n=1 Tax=Pyxidicoccus xibeiensis TaxID=2906759 RepID=UPI0020A8221F|nr:hypothetical protein [Pyxidicoccus xibeiensis]MCP3142184.1 hypothetical protein [Pyxidicoccus xibeiensis]